MAGEAVVAQGRARGVRRLPDGVPTTWAQHYGDPWPATRRPEVTSVGARALDQFTRQDAFRDVRADGLPPARRDDNLWGVPRRVEGVLVPGSVERS